MKNEMSLSNQEKVYHAISTTFCVIVVLSNIISAKIVVLPYLNFSIPAGLITYPLTFLLGDLVTEIFGVKKAKLMIYTALGMNLLSFGIIEITLLLPTEMLETQNAFHTVLDLSSLRIFSSLIAYIVAQIADIYLYAMIKRWTGPNLLWLRNNGSTCISQMIDTLIIDIIFLYWGLGMAMNQVLPIMIFSYAYKTFFSLSSTPLFYFCVFIIQKKLKYNNQLCLQNLTLTHQN
ncbi:hypothetical protein PHSC3_001549 [Chlamydiales bacterium STE3]|nr:hypothetical protein PHSC3_001549 [Chlamydiales bacterium STE3]